MKTKMRLDDMAQLVYWHADEVGNDFVSWFAEKLLDHSVHTGHTETQMAEKLRLSAYRVTDWITLAYDIRQDETYFVAQDLDRLQALSYEARELYGREHHTTCPCRYVGYCGETLWPPRPATE
jgi:hypothetical protein